MAFRVGSFAAMAGAVFAVGPFPACAATFQAIYDFRGSYGDGQQPESGLVVDNAGRLVGATPLGGAAFDGVIYRLTPPTQVGSSWTEQVLYDFASAGFSIADPFGPVVLLGDSTILGTAASGGQGGGGVVYRLDNSEGQWKLKVLHNFTGGADGGDPYPGVTLGPSGLLYGPTLTGSAYGNGAFYSISPDGGPASFKSLPQAGIYGASRPTAISSNRLVFTSTYGGSSGLGAVVLVQENSPGHYHMVPIYSFTSAGDAATPSPDSPLLRGPKGMLYGCAAGGAFGIGAVYLLTPPVAVGAPWTEKVLYSFGAQPSDPDGTYGQCYIAAGSNGRLVGVATRGGSHGSGALFALDPPAQPGAPWSETVLHNFNARNSGFYLPRGVPMRIENTYYGTAMFGGAAAGFGGTGGGVWSFTP